ncbi:MAG: hypothetical protein Q8O74_04035 [bacterium]|nr:hypothetical protein [bacterium]
MPLLTAVANPLVLIVATAVLDEDHVKATPVRVLLLESRATAVNCWVVETLTVGASGEMVTLLTVAVLVAVVSSTVGVGVVVGVLLQPSQVKGNAAEITSNIATVNSFLENILVTLRLKFQFT